MIRSSVSDTKSLVQNELTPSIKLKQWSVPEKVSLDLSNTQGKVIRITWGEFTDGVGRTWGPS